MVAKLTEAACAIAESSAPLEPALVEEEMAKYVAGRVNALFHARAAGASEQSFQEAARAGRADQEQEIVDEVAEDLLAEAEQIAAGGQTREARKREAEAEVDEQRERIGVLPLIEKVKTGWPVAIVAMTATSAGVGTLAHLSLEGVSESWAHVLVTIAAVGGAFASELLIGTLGAETYDRIPDDKRRWALVGVLLLIVAILVGTEVFAALARQQGVVKANGFSIDLRTGQPKPSGGLTPSLLWTAPLAVLVTVGGAGVVGVARLREASAPVRDGLRIARDRLAEARRDLEKAERRQEQLREQASSTRERAARLRGESDVARAQSERLVGALDQLSRRHAELIAAITAEAILRYRIASANLAREGGRAPRPPSDPVRRLPAIVGFAGVAGIAVSLATASVLSGMVVASLVLAAATMRTV